MEQSGEQRSAGQTQSVSKEKAIALINEVKRSGDNVLSLENLGLEKVPEQLFDLETLEALNLSSNKLREIPSEIRRLKNLRKLIVDHNLLETLPDELCCLEHLETLTVTNNRLKTLPVGFWRLRELVVLDVSSNKAAVPPAVGLLPRLAILSADRDQLPVEVRDMRSDETASAFRDHAHKLFTRTWDDLIRLNLESEAQADRIKDRKDAVERATAQIARYEEYLAAKSTEAATDKLISGMKAGLWGFGAGALLMLGLTGCVGWQLYDTLVLKQSWAPKGAAETYVWQYINRSAPAILLAALLFVLVKLTLAMLHNFTAINHKRAMLLTLNHTVQGFGAKMEGENIAKLLHEIVAHQPTGFVKGSGGDESAINIGPIGLKQ